MAKIALCPNCSGKISEASFYVTGDGSVGEFADWGCRCPSCQFTFNGLGESGSRSGTRAGAISVWNTAIGEYQVFKAIKESTCISFDGGTDYHRLLESLNFTPRQLSLFMGKLVKDGYLDKVILTAHDIDGVRDGKKYASFSLSSYWENYENYSYRTMVRRIEKFSRIEK